MTRQSLSEVKKRFAEALQAVATTADLDALEQRFFSRTSGEVTRLMHELKDLPPEAKKEKGKEINDFKEELSRLLEEKKHGLREAVFAAIAENEAVDVTQPKLPPRRAGHLHPATLVEYQLEELFTSMGFRTLSGPELESDYYNFTAVNIPPDHPARDMQDTFYIKDHPAWVMRTHTSSVQVRAMEQYGAPLRMIVPGRCFRNEATDPRHEHTFSQLEGVVIDRNISLSHMKGVLEAVSSHLYGPEAKVRLRPKFYPFVEPGVNGEMSCFLCQMKGCRVCKGTGWLEIFGAGMIHPNVLKAGGIDPAVFQGFAFGLGLTRLVMLKYGIEDVRLLQSGDLQFLQQFS